MLIALHSCFGAYFQEGRSSGLQAIQPNPSAEGIYGKSPPGSRVPVVTCTSQLPESEFSWLSYQRIAEMFLPSEILLQFERFPTANKRAEESKINLVMMALIFLGLINLASSLMLSIHVRVYQR